MLMAINIVEATSRSIGSFHGLCLFYLYSLVGSAAVNHYSTAAWHEPFMASTLRVPVPRTPEVRPLFPLGRRPLALVSRVRDLHEPLEQHGPRVDVDEPA